MSPNFAVKLPITYPAGKLKAILRALARFSPHQNRPTTLGPRRAAGPSAPAVPLRALGARLRQSVIFRPVIVLGRQCQK